MNVITGNAPQEAGLNSLALPFVDGGVGSLAELLQLLVRICLSELWARGLKERERGAFIREYCVMLQQT